MNNNLFQIPKKEEKLQNIKINLPNNLDELCNNIFLEELNRLSIRLERRFSEDEKNSIIQKSRDLLDHNINLLTQTNNSLFDSTNVIITNFTELENKKIKINATSLKDKVFTVNEFKKEFFEMLFTNYRTAVVYSILGH